MAIPSPSSSPHRRPPPPPPPPRSPRPNATPTPSTTTSSRNSTTKLPTSGDDNNSKPISSYNKPLHLNGNTSPYQHVSDSTKRPTPLPSSDDGVGYPASSASIISASSATPRSSLTSSPLKAAASLIQTLDRAHSEMTSFAADAARDAEVARRNARKAQEIARRYQNRFFPTTTTKFSSFVDGPDDPLTNGDSGNNGGWRSNVGPVLEFASSSSSVNMTSALGSTTSTPTPAKPRPPRLRPYKEQNSDDHDDGTAKDDDDENGTLNVAAVPLQTPTQTVDVATTQPPPQDQPLTDPMTRTFGTVVGTPPRRAIHTPSSVADRIAQQHADDILELNQELERTKVALRAKERAKEECEVALSSLKAKNKRLEEQNRKLLSDMEEERTRATQQVTALEKGLELERRRVQEANEDADLAVDFAKASTEERNQFEHELEKALEELQMWRERARQWDDGEKNGNGNRNHMGGGGQGNIVVAGTPKRHVRFADQSLLPAGQNEQNHQLEGEGETIAEFETPRSSNRPSRSIVAAGRQVLRRNLASSPDDAITMLELTPTKAAELRERLRQRLAQLEEDTSSPKRVLLSGSPSHESGDRGANTSVGSATKKKLDECYTAIKILQTSGKKLDLDGYWWRDHQLHITATSSSSKASTISQSEIQLDAMTRQYCQNVEFKIDRQQKEIKQLESLCDFLEKKLVMDQE